LQTQTKVTMAYLQRGERSQPLSHQANSLERCANSV